MEVKEDGKETKESKSAAPSAGTGLELPKKPKISLFIGKPGSGKTHALRAIMREYFRMKHFGFGLAFVATKYNDDYKFLPDNLVVDDYSDKKLAKYIKHLAEIREKNGSIPPNFLILDDLLGKIDFYSPEVSHFLSTFRHTNTYVFLTSQYLGARGSSTALREYANYIFMWRSTSGNSVDLLYYAFGQFSNGPRMEKMFANREEFVDVLMEATDVEKHKHRCLLLINEMERPPTFFFWKAPETKDFKVSFASDKNARGERKF